MGGVLSLVDVGNCVQRLGLDWLQSLCTRAIKYCMLRICNKLLPGRRWLCVNNSGWEIEFDFQITVLRIKDLEGMFVAF